MIVNSPVNVLTVNGWSYEGCFIMGFAVQSLLLCSFCGMSSVCWLNFTIFEFVMVSIIPSKFLGASLGTVNCTMPNCDEAGYDNRMFGLEESS